MIWFASLRANLGEVDGAIQMARRAVALDPNNFLYHLVLGNILFSAANYEDAGLASQNASRLAPTEGGPLVLAAFVAIRRGDDADAVSKLRLVEELNLRSAHYQLPRIALAYAQAGQPEDAQRVVAVFEQTNEPFRAEIATTSAAWIVAYIALGDYEEALARLIDAVGRNEPGDFVVLNEIRTNFYGDPVLDSDPRFVAARGRLRFTE
jgi:tetratricopeptide (TPR) repeat protein